MFQPILGGAVSSLGSLLVRWAAGHLINQGPTVRVGRAVANMPFSGTVEALTITVQNRTDRVLYLGNIFLELETGDQFMPLVDPLTGHRQGNQVVLRSGNSFALHVLASDLANSGYPPSAFRCAAARDAVDRIYRSSPAELQRALRRYCHPSVR